MWCSAFSLVLSLGVWPGPTAGKDLPPKYRAWLQEDVVYIITPREKDVFLRLETDRERDLFIEAFWKQRDPSPGTPINEFREDHYRRIQYANKMFGRTTFLPGWKSERGRFAILIGEPQDIERFIGDAEVRNAEVWFYQDLTKYGLPPGFYLVFYQKEGVGDYVLYHPTSDGPQALLTSYLGDQGNPLQAYRKLDKLYPQLAQVSLNLIPGESQAFGRPSLASEVLLQSIQALPEKEVNDRYAEKFLAFKDVIEVEYSANYIDNDSLVKIFQDPAGFHFVHYIIELRRFSVHEKEGRYATNLRMNGKVSDLNGRTIFQYEAALPVELSEDQLKRITYQPFDLYDMFPLIPGTYNFSLILKNEASQEFTSIEKEIVIPENDSPPRLSGLLLGYRIEPGSAPNLKPFRLGQRQVLCQPRNIFLGRETLFLNLQILGPTLGLKRNGSLRFEILRQKEKVLSFTRNVGDYPNPLDILEEFPLANFPPDAYWLTVTLEEDGRVLETQREPFEITPVVSLPRPWVFSQTYSPPSHPGYSFALGKQFMNQGGFDQALGCLKKAYQAQPNSQDYALALAQVYSVLKDHLAAKDVLMPFLESSNPRYEVLFFLGQALQNLGASDQAVAVFNRAISHFGINANVLNALGESYYQLGDIKRALAAWTKSLEIDPGQKALRDRAESLKKREEQS
jgi:GWxTD domain-containing protein